MRRATRSQPRAVPKLAIAAGACAAIAAVACITAPPPDLPSLPPQRPTAIHQAVVPAEGLLLQWPSDGGSVEGQFLVPVQVAASGDSFVYSVFLDSILIWDGTGSQTAPDGGITLVQFPALLPDTATCPHQLEFIVAHGWANAAQRQTPDAVGGDVVKWTYYNGGPGGPQGCPLLDAGTGAFPEASLDGLAVPPEAGGDP